MRIAVFEAWSGVAGDMWVGALLDAGVPMAPLQAAVRSLRLPGVSIRAARVLRGGVSGTHFVVDADGAPADAGSFVPVGNQVLLRLPSSGAHAHRGLRDIEAIVGAAELPAEVTAHALAIYRAIGEVEARAHGVSIEAVHFHEVGAVDTIVDVVCACYATHLLGVDAIHARGIEVGGGTVRAAHGVLPVPAPATAALLDGIPVRRSLAGERTTPTGAALLRHFVDHFDHPVTMTSEAIGYGAGTRDDATTPNLLRVTIGNVVVASSPTELVELQCQLDTATGEQLGWLLDELLSRGAVDAFATPITMKKGRPGVLLTVLADGPRADVLQTLLLEESSTLGVRRHVVQRAVLERWNETRATVFGPVRCKLARLPSGVVVVRAEDDELRRLCREQGLGRAEVLRRLQLPPA